MRKLVILLAVTMMLLGCWAGIAGAIHPIDQAMIEEKNNLRDSGKASNDYLDHSIIDLANITNGTVITYTYSGDSEALTINNFSVDPNGVSEASNKMTSFAFSLTNQYRPDTVMSISNVSPELTVQTYTYGSLKHELMLAFISGLPDCLNSEALNRSSDDSSWTEKYTPETMTKEVFTSFKIGEATYATSDGTVQTMDVVPEIVDDRTFVPVRFLAYSLGVPEEDVTWEQETQTVTITKDDTTITLTIGSTTETVNDEPVEMDTAPYIKEIETGGRTMLPARWIAEPLGATVTWDETTQQVTIEIPSSPDQEQGQ